MVGGWWGGVRWGGLAALPCPVLPARPTPPSPLRASEPIPLSLRWTCMTPLRTCMTCPFVRPWPRFVRRLLPLPALHVCPVVMMVDMANNFSPSPSPGYDGSGTGCHVLSYMSYMSYMNYMYLQPCPSAAGGYRANYCDGMDGMICGSSSSERERDRESERHKPIPTLAGVQYLSFRPIRRRVSNDSRFPRDLTFHAPYHLIRFCFCFGRCTIKNKK